MPPHALHRLQGPSLPRYARRRPELTPCYRIIQEHLSTFIAEREAEGRPLPDYVIQEFEAYLKCGIPAYGFLRLQCEKCDEEKIVAFSCKRRGFCPSCCARRQVEAAAHLVEEVLPLIPYRQFVLSFPIPLRYWLHSNSQLYVKVHAIVIAEIHRYYIDKARREGIKDPAPGSISFTQRWGSARNLNPHMHVLCADGVYARVNSRASFRPADAITDDEVAALVEAIAHKVMRHLQKQGYLSKDGDIVANPLADDVFREYDALSLATSSSIAGKIAFGPNAGKYVTRIGSGFGYGEEIPLIKGKRCASLNGFSLHANTAINTLQRDRLSQLIEYVARGPLSNERLQIREDGKVVLQLKSKWADGTSHLLFTAGEFIEKLAALIPPPRSHLVRWAGVFAPNSPFRKEITLKPEAKKGFDFAEDGEDGSGCGKRRKNYKNYNWSKMLARVFQVDVLKCECCGGHLRPVCAVTDSDSIRRYLKHMDIDYDPPPRGPPRFTQDAFDFEGGDGWTFPD